MLKIIYIRQLRELLNEKRTFVMILMAGIIMIFMPFQFFSSLQESPLLFNTAIDFYFTFYSIIIVLMLGYSANHTLFLREKTTKTLHSLLSTPLDIKTIWMGKIMAIFSIGYVLSLLLSFLFLILIHQVFDPVVAILPTLQGYLSLFVINPIISMSILGLLGIFTLISKDELILKYGFFIIIFGTIYFFKPDKITIGNSIILFQFALSIVLVIINYLCSKLLSNEKIILSSE